MNRDRRILWQGNEYVEENEPYFEVVPCDLPEDFDDIECLANLLHQTKKEMNNQTIPQFPDSARWHTEKDGSKFIIVKNGFQKISLNKKTLINTLSDKNELIQTSIDPNKAWLLGFGINDDEK